MISTAGSCEGKSSILQTIVQTGLEIILPLKTKTVHPTEPPWIIPFLKMIKERQRALSQGQRAEFRHLRNRINRERKVCSSKYNQSRVQHLKECSSAAWWKGIKRLGGITTPFETRGNALKSIHHLKGAGSLTPTELANHISTAFLAPTEGFEPLTNHPFGEGNDSSSNDPVPTVLEVSVFRKLSALNSTKAQGPDNIPGWLLKENGDLLAGAVSDILNAPYREGCLPPAWKEADVVPVPKQRPIRNVSKHLRPISLTPMISKVAEDYVV